MILELALVLILIIFAWYARKYVLYLYFIYIAIILYLMWEYNCKISAFHVPGAHIPIIWLWMRKSGELEGSEFRCYVTMITMLNTLLPLRTPSTLPIRHMCILRHYEGHLRNNISMKSDIKHGKNFKDTLHIHV